MSAQWGAAVIQAVIKAAGGAALILLIALTAPGWLAFAFLPSDRQDRLLSLMRLLVSWVRSL